MSLLRPPDVPRRVQADLLIRERRRRRGINVAIASYALRWVVIGALVASLIIAVLHLVG